MVSLVDATKPLDGVPAVKSELRDNLQTIKSEIEALQQVVPLGSRVFDVTDPQFAGGAVGDGVNDDYPAIQAAIDALTQGPRRGVIFFPKPADHYRVNYPRDVSSATSNSDPRLVNALWVGDYVGGVDKENVGQIFSWDGDIAFVGESYGIRLRLYGFTGGDITTDIQFTHGGNQFYRGGLIQVSGTNQAGATPPNFFMKNLILDNGIDNGFTDTNVPSRADPDLWDLSSKNLLMTTLQGVVHLEDCEFINARGEILFQGGSVTDRFNILRCKVGNTNGNGCNYQPVRHFICRDCEFFDCANDAFEVPCFGIAFVDNNVFKRVATVLISRIVLDLPPNTREQYDRSGMYFTNNHVQDGQHGGIWALNYAAHIKNNVFQNCQSDIIKLDFTVGGPSFVDFRSENIISGNTIFQRDESALSGISIQGTDTAPNQRMLIENNYFDVADDQTGTIKSFLTWQSVNDPGKNIIIRNNILGKVRTFISILAGSKTTSGLYPCIYGNHYIGRDEPTAGFNFSELYNAVSAATPEVELIGRVRLNAPLGEFGAVPVIDPSKYQIGTECIIDSSQGGIALDPVRFPRRGTHFRCPVDRILYAGVHMVMRFDGSHFYEVEYRDTRAPVETITNAALTEVDAKAKDQVILNYPSAQTITSHNAFCAGKTVEIVSTNGNTTLQNNATIDTGTGADVLMQAGKVYFVRETDGGVLQVLNG